MRHARLGLAVRLGRPDIEAAVDLAGVGGDDGDGGESGERNRDGGFADAGGADDDWGLGSGVRYGQTAVPIPLWGAAPCSARRGRPAPGGLPWTSARSA